MPTTGSARTSAANRAPGANTPPLFGFTSALCVGYVGWFSVTKAAQVEVRSGATECAALPRAERRGVGAVQRVDAVAQRGVPPPPPRGLHSSTSRLNV